MKRSSLRAKPKPSDNDSYLSAVWIDAVCGPKARCAKCDRPGGRQLEGHHPVPQQALKREFPWGAVYDGDLDAWVYVARGDGVRLAALGQVKSLQAILWTPANGLALCRWCHAAHTGGIKIPFERLRPESVTFAAAMRTRHGVDLVPILEREHPRRSDALDPSAAVGSRNPTTSLVSERDASTTEGGSHHGH